MVNNHQDNGLAISTPIPRADAVKNAYAAPMGQVGASPATWESDKAQDSAPPYSPLRQGEKLYGGIILSPPHDTHFVVNPLSVSGEGITDTIFQDNPRPSIDGLARVCSYRDAPLTGGGFSNRPQSFSFQSGHGLSHKLASSFPSHSQIASSGLKP